MNIDELINQRENHELNKKNYCFKCDRFIYAINKKIEYLRSKGIKTKKELDDEKANTPKTVERKSPDTKDSAEA
ncbi:MAG: hypothetical protein EOM12_16045 [Verrucomicrobiae bacterium]|nr:hypothetical protein [Verrucomicrobiae bacterium]